MLSRLFFRRGRRAGFTIIETMIALTISSAAMIMVVSVNMMASRFATEGYREVQIMNETSNAIEYMTRYLNQAYRLDADTAAYRFQIQNNNQTIEFSIPSAGGGTVNRERFRFDSGANTLSHERRNGAGTFALVGAGPLLRNIDSFAIDNQEGILSMVARMRVSIPRYQDKQFTLIGRALPRNI